MQKENETHLVGHFFASKLQAREGVCAFEHVSTRQQVEIAPLKYEISQNYLNKNRKQQLYVLQIKLYVCAILYGVLIEPAPSRQMNKKSGSLQPSDDMRH